MKKIFMAEHTERKEEVIFMKRFWSAVIDFVICYILSRIFWGWIWEILKGIHGDDLYSLSRLTVRVLRFVISFLVYFSYSILFDSLSQGNTLGRDMVGYRFCDIEEEIADDWVLKHSFFKAIAAKLWFITVIYYFITTKMPYDGILGIGGEDAYFHFTEEEKRKDQYVGKRIVAMIIDAVIILLILLFIAFIIACYTFFVTRGKQTHIHINLSSAYSILCYFAYFFITEIIFRGSGIGKKIVGIHLVTAEGRIDSMVVLKHSLLKSAACYLWPISLIYCLITGRMFYDEWLKLETVAGR